MNDTEQKTFAEQFEHMEKPGRWMPDDELATTKADAHRAGREAMREEAARVALDWATDRAGQGFPGHEDMAQMGDAIRALPLAPVEATPPATEEPEYEYRRRAAPGHSNLYNNTTFEEPPQVSRGDTIERRLLGPWEPFTPRPDFGPTPREGDNA